MRPLPAAEALDRYFLEARCKLLEVAAILDRIDRGGKLANDSRLDKIKQALAAIKEKSGNRAEELQQIFSLPYEAGWERPKPR